jgi:tRNA A-37 threonylcarbamoyl transferase component Bud32
MTSQDLSLRELFEAAFERPPEDRAGYLDLHCANAARRAFVERMLEATTGPASGLPSVPAAALAQAMGEPGSAPTLPPGSRIGPFELIDVLGEGGSSTVFRAVRDVDGVRQEVALKLLRRGLYSPDAQRQFRRERQILSQLRHPGIARLIEGGVTDTGAAYIALDLVDGVPITEHARDRRLDLRDRLRLFIDVCRAVDAAHRALIVHRDLKPSNVLVTADGSVKLLDFGIAKLLDAEDDTQTRLPAFTPAYASPEQRSNGLITTATDVYALGILLGELMTGERMTDGGSRTPSSHVSGQHRPGTLPANPKTTRRQLRGDLDNIVLKALEDDPGKRYASAGTFADDIERLLDGRPVVAHPPSTWYRARKFVTRHRGGVATTVAFLLAILAALGMALWQAGVARRQAEVAREQAKRADAVQAFLVDVFETNSSYQSDQAKARATTAQQLLEIGANRIDNAMADAPEAKAKLLNLFGMLHAGLGLDAEAVQIFRKAVAHAEALHGESSPDAFDARMQLADELHSSNSDDEAKVVLEQAQAALDRIHDEDPARRAKLLDQFSQYYATRDLKLALDYARKSVALYGQLPASWDIGFALSHKARVEHQSGLDADAIASYTRAIAMSRSVDGDANPDLPRFYAELGELEYAHHDIVDGEHNAREALRLARSIHGEDHVDVVQCEMRLGRLLADTGRPQEGLPLLADAKRKILALRGADDGFHTPQVFFQNGVVLIHTGRLEEGLADVEAAIVNRRHNRPGTIPLAQFLETAAAADVELGRFADAQTHLVEAQAIREKAGQAPPSMAFDGNVATSIALALAQGDADRAATLLPSLSASTGAADRLDFQDLSNRLLAAEVASAAGRQTEAIGQATAIRGAIEASAVAVYYGALSSRASAIEGVARLRSGDALLAIPLLQHALAQRRKELDPSSPRIAQVQVALAESEFAGGDVIAARALADEATRIEDAHRELGTQYRAPLDRLRAKLDSRPPKRQR